MKRFLLGLLTIVMCFTMVGCGDKKEDIEPVDDTEYVEEDVYSDSGSYDYGDYNEEEFDDEYGYDPYYD